MAKGRQRSAGRFFVGRANRALAFAFLLVQGVREKRKAKNAGEKDQKVFLGDGKNGKDQKRDYGKKQAFIIRFRTVVRPLGHRNAVFSWRIFCRPGK